MTHERVRLPDMRKYKHGSIESFNAIREYDRAMAAEKAADKAAARKGIKGGWVKKPIVKVRNYAPTYRLTAYEKLNQAKGGRVRKSDVAAWALMAYLAKRNLSPLAPYLYRNATSGIVSAYM